MASLPGSNGRGQCPWPSPICDLRICDFRPNEPSTTIASPGSSPSRTIVWLPTASPVRIEVPNKRDLLHAGDFVEVLFEAVADTGGGKGAQQLAVPTQAIVQLSGETVVFRRTESGAFEPVSIRAGEAVGNQTTVLGGLEPGDAIVVEGAFGLKSQILKSQMGEGHGH